MISTTAKPTFLDYQVKLKGDFLQLKSYSNFAQKRLGGRVFSDEILYNGFGDIDKYLDEGIQKTHVVLYHFAGKAMDTPSMQTGMNFASCYNELLELKNKVSVQRGVSAATGERYARLGGTEYGLLRSSISD